MSRTCPDCQTQYEDEIAYCPEDGLDLFNVPQDDELIGRSIGSYQVVKPLGKGGMGAVYMAEHPVIGSRVAIKFLHPQYSNDKTIVDRFFNEARAVNVIGHDNILKILDLNVTEDNRHYFIMEFLYGKGLQDLVKPDVPVPLEVAGPILLQTCEALQAAHDNNIIHRDLKPDNIYLIIHKGRKNFVKVVDFGIAKLTDEQGQSTGQTQTGIVMGTPAYMSPEQAGGMTSSIDGRSDIYSLGCMMFQMATGKVPFPGTSFGQVLIGHLQLAPPAPRSLNPDIPEDYEAVILKTLAKEQEARHQTMQELHDAIGAVMDAHGITRELPIADAQEIAAGGPGSKAKTGPGTKLKTGPGTKLKTGPGTNFKTGSGTKPTSKPAMVRKPPTSPGPAPATVALAPPARSNTGFIAAVAISVMVLVAGTVGAVLWQSHQSRMAAQDSEERKAQQASEASRKAAEQAREEQEKKKLEDKKLSMTQPAVLTIDSDPVGARVDASWKDQKQTGQTPLKIYVPPNSAVHLSFTKDGYAAVSRDLVAEGPQQISIGLIVEKRAAARSVKPKGPRMADDEMDVTF